VIALAWAVAAGRQPPASAASNARRALRWRFTEVSVRRVTRAGWPGPTILGQPERAAHRPEG
jgi:hypothetical protein